MSTWLDGSETPAPFTTDSVTSRLESVNRLPYWSYTSTITGPSTLPTRALVGEASNTSDVGTDGS